jgi:hypothetical protein
MKKVWGLILVLTLTASAAITNYFHIKTDGTGTVADSATTWANAWNSDTLEKYVENAADLSGAVFYLKQGSYTLAAAIDFNLKDGTPTAPIVFIGVKSGTTDTASLIDSSDWARSNWRAIDTTISPSINCGNYQFKTGDNTIIKNIIFYGNCSSSGDYLLAGGSRLLVENCVLNCSYSSSASRYAVYLGAYSSIIGCMVMSANCKGAYIASSMIKIKYCKFLGFSDATNGIAITVSGTGPLILGNVFNRILFLKTVIFPPLLPYTTRTPSL